MVSLARLAVMAWVVQWFSCRVWERVFPKNLCPTFPKTISEPTRKQQKPEALKDRVFKFLVCFRSLKWAFLRKKISEQRLCEVPFITPKRNCEEL